jgi:hypothetical protein
MKYTIQVIQLQMNLLTIHILTAESESHSKSLLSDLS